MQGASERKTGAYTPVCEDLSAEATQQFVTGSGFRKKSIDEAFLQYDTCHSFDLLCHAKNLRQKILKWTGLPVSKRGIRITSS